MLSVNNNMDACDMLMEDEGCSQRKANKPLMEKRRRARINRSLMELKSILVESLKKSTPGHSKWEKADILEMTVQYLQCLKNQQQATKSDPLSVGQFIAGFSECIRQIQKFNTDTKEEPEPHKTDPALQKQLIDFLLSYLKNFSDDATKGLRSPNCSPESSPKIIKIGSPSTPRTKSRQDSGFLTPSPTSPISSNLSPKSPTMSPGTCSNGSVGSASGSIADSPSKLDNPGLTVSIPKPTPIHNSAQTHGSSTNGSPYLTLFMNSGNNRCGSRSQAFHPYSMASTQGTKTTLLQQLQGPPVSVLNGNQLPQGFTLPYHPLLPGEHKDFPPGGSPVWRPW